ncbi:MAG: hypothetical protein AABX99_04035, partial [Nanoarchaeota archaeon]
MNKKEEAYSLLLKELEKIADSLRGNYDTKTIEGISQSLKLEEYSFLEEETMKQTNELLKKVINISIINMDEPTLIKLIEIYSLNTQFYLDNIDKNKKSYLSLFLDNLDFY